MDYYSMRKQFSAYSAIFNLTSSSTFMRDGISNKVIVLYNDDNEINLPINNEMRLKSNLYNYNKICNKKKQVIFDLTNLFLKCNIIYSSSSDSLN